jgi:hypothetical protein
LSNKAVDREAAVNRPEIRLKLAHQLDERRAHRDDHIAAVR